MKDCKTVKKNKLQNRQFCMVQWAVKIFTCFGSYVYFHLFIQYSDWNMKNECKIYCTEVWHRALFCISHIFCVVVYFFKEFGCGVAILKQCKELSNFVFQIHFFTEYCIYSTVNFFFILIILFLRFRFDMHFVLTHIQFFRLY